MSQIRRDLQAARIEIFVVARARLLAHAVARALDAETDLAVLGCCCDLGQAAEALRRRRLDIVVLDTALVPEPARPWIRRLAAERPDLRILSIGLDGEAEILQCLEAGAVGYLPRGASLEQLVERIRIVASGAPTCPPKLVAAVMARIHELAARIEPLTACSAPENGTLSLTAREHQVLEAAARGLDNREIAGLLGLALSTVKAHVHKILRKFGVPNRRVAAQRALELGLLDSSAQSLTPRGGTPWCKPDSC